MHDRDASIDLAFEKGRAAWPGVELPPEVFRAALPPDRDPSQLFASDLYLALACARADAAAIDHLERGFLSRIFLDEVRQELRVRLLLPRPGKPPRIAAYAGRGSLMSWIQVTAARVAIDLKRRVNRSPDPILISPPPRFDPERDHLRERYRDELQSAFEEAVADLSSRQRNILRMHFLDGAPLDSLATMYGVHRTTIGRWLQQACDQILASTRRKLGARVRLPPGAMDSLVGMLKSELDFSASFLIGASSSWPEG